MTVYVNSAGFAPEHDYCWTASGGHAFRRHAEFVAFLEVFDCGRVIDLNERRVVLAASPAGDVLLAAVGVPGVGTDYAGRPIRVSVFWVEPDTPAARGRFAALFDGLTVGDPGPLAVAVRLVPAAPGYAADFGSLVRLAADQARLAEPVPAGVGVLKAVPAVGAAGASRPAEPLAPSPPRWRPLVVGLLLLSAAAIVCLAAAP